MDDDIRQEVYRIYITESLYALGEGKRLEAHYKDVVNPKPEETRSSEEIISGIKNKLKGGK